MDYLLYVAMLLFLGTILTFLAAKIKVSNIFFLTLAGLVLGLFGLLELPIEFLEVISTITLIMIVFEGVSGFRTNDIKKIKEVTVLLVVFFLVNAIITSIAAYYVLQYFGMGVPFLLCVVFSILMFAIDETVSLSVLENKKNHVVEVLEIEALANSPFAIVIPLILLKFYTSEVVISKEILNLSLGLIIPIIMGVVISYLVIFFLRFDFFKEFGYLIVLSGCLISYAASDLFNAQGIIAIVIFGILFSKSNVIEKHKIESQATIIGHILLILVFLLLGSLVAVESETRTFESLVAGTIIFVIYLFVRFISVCIACRKFGLREKIFMTLAVPKGVDVAVVIILMTQIPGLEIIKNLSLLFVLYSIVLATIAAAFGNYFLESI